MVFPQIDGRRCGACGPPEKFGALPPLGYQPRCPDELVGPSFACETLRLLSAKLLLKATQLEPQRMSQGCADSCGPMPPRELLSPSVVSSNFLKGLSSLQNPHRLEKEWRPTPRHRRTHPNTAFETPGPVQGTCMQTTRSSLVVNIQVAFCRAPEAFQDSFALDPFSPPPPTHTTTTTTLPPPLPYRLEVPQTQRLSHGPECSADHRDSPIAAHVVVDVLVHR